MNLLTRLLWPFRKQPMVTIHIERDPGIQAVMDAWTDAGPVPEYHIHAQYELRRTWPTLAGALDRLTREPRE